MTESEMKVQLQRLAKDAKSQLARVDDPSYNEVDEDALGIMDEGVLAGYSDTFKWEYWLRIWQEA